ncbi:MAG: polysaccharide biosynthesis protein [Bacteroidales bacterium]|nr:polysaccharide biosynthesis protein [Bacteroidales bacterium]
MIKKFANWYFSKQALPYWCILLFDMAVVLVSGIFCYTLDHGVLHTINSFWPVVGTLSFYLIFFVIGFRLTHTYSGVLRYSSFTDLYRIVIANLFGITCIVVARWFLSFDSVFVPIRSKELIFVFLMSTVIMFGVRLLVKFLFEKITEDKNRRGAFIYGVKQGGIALSKAIRAEYPNRFVLRGFVTEESDMVGHILQGVNVYRNDEELIAHMAEEHATALLVSPLKREEVFNNEELTGRLLDAGIGIYQYDQAQKWDGHSAINASQLQEVQIEDLLPRDEIQVDLEAVARMLSGSCILITGSAGSIGSEMVRQVAKFGPQKLILVDEAETPQHSLRLEIKRDFHEIDAVTIVTSITNKERMESIFKTYRPQFVFHAAAYKHVPMMEDNPSEAVLNNIIGTRNIADLSVKYGVKKFVMVSTDKAVNPTNVMGCSKRICEIYVQSLDKAIKENNINGVTQFVTTRFGNVLGSNGSVIPLFREQIRNGGPVTVTHPDIIRFFMLIPEACKLVLEAGTMGRGGEIFVFDMGKPVKIADLARRMIKLSGAQNVEIRFTGLRDGEKLYEEVLNDEEITKPTFNHKIKIAQVREYDYQEVCTWIDELFKISCSYDNMATVKQMKRIVPEYKSQHSVYEELDKEEEDGEK